jgi:thiamine biosynthesis lipoprotein
VKYYLRFYPILFITILLACSASYKKYKAHYFAMDTVVEVTLFAKSKRTAKNAVDKMIEESQRIEKLFSAFTPGSEVKKINERKSRDRIVVDYEVLSVIKTALEYGKETEGLFDITIGPVKWLWGFSAHQKPRIPPDSQIQALLTHVDYSKICIEKTGSGYGKLRDYVLHAQCRR